MNSIKNKNLLKIIHTIQNFDDDELPLELNEILNVELYVSTVICPAVDENSIQLMCSESRQDELFIPTFTSLEKYYDFFGFDSFNPMECSFESLLAGLDDNVVGIMINPASDDFFLPMDYLMDIERIDFPEINNGDISKSKFKQFINSIDNDNLFTGIESDDFILDEDYDSVQFVDFLKKLKNTPLFVMLTSSGLIKGKSKDNIYRARKVSNLGFYLLDNGFHESTLVFSSEKLACSEHTHKEINQKFFIKPISFAYLVELVLKMDVGAIIINHSSNPIFLHRDLLIHELDNILEYAHNDDLDSFDSFVKLI